MSKISDIFKLYSTPEVYNKTMAVKGQVAKGIAPITNLLSTAAPVAGGLLSMGANQPGQDPNIGNSILGGALSGAGAGLPGIIAGGLSGFLTAARNKQTYETNLDLLQKQNFADKTVAPAMFDDGGLALTAEEDFLDAQLDKDEIILLPTGELVPSASTESHDDMDDDQVTDMVPAGSYIFSSKKEIDTRKIKEEDDVLAKFPGVYKDGKYTKVQEIRLTDIIGKGKMTFAEAAKKVDKKIPIEVDNKKDIYAKKANDLNIETRIPHLMKLMELQSKANG